MVPSSDHKKGTAMTGKLLKTKWYIVDLDSKRVLTERIYGGFWRAVDAESKLSEIANFTALRGSHLLQHEGKPWIISVD